jgi:pimeloyl-ACP methyl ester carboxylesterase
LLFGHSSGGTVALEALVASPLSFAGGMIYEPASVSTSADGLHLSEDRIEREGSLGEGLRRARQALVKGQPGTAIGIFTQVVAGWPRFLANPAGALTALVPAYRRLIPCQIDDLEAMERLGVRLDAYSKLNLPVAMVGGERSPDFNKEMVAAVADVLPRVERITLSGQGHGCHVRDPQKLAEVIETFAKRVFE